MPVTGDLTVYVLEAVQHARDNLALLLARTHLRFQILNTTDALLAALTQGQGGCILIVLPDDPAARTARLELPPALRAAGIHLPVVFIGDAADGRDVRAAFRAGALDVLPLPADSTHLSEAIEEAFAGEQARLALRLRKKRRAALFDRLTPRESEVALLVTRGLDNGQIALQLGISHRTVEVHKARVMRKLGTSTLADLIQLRG